MFCARSHMTYVFASNVLKRKETTVAQSRSRSRSGRTRVDEPEYSYERCRYRFSREAVCTSSSDSCMYCAGVLYVELNKWRRGEV